MCKDIQDNNNASIKIENLHDSQVLSEENVKNFIKNIQNIYPPKELRIYSQRYPQEYNNFNDGLMLGILASSWCMPPPVMVINNGYGYGMGYNEYGYNNNNYNPPPNYYDGNPNPDSAVGGFQNNNNNIEMADFSNNNNNNNNNNNGGNFGGYGNNNSNDGGDFGGGDFDVGGDF